MIPRVPYEPDFTNSKYLRAYCGLLESMGIRHSEKGFLVKRSDFANGYAIYGFDLAPTQNCAPCVSPPRRGNARLEINFSANTTSAINVICLAEFDALIEIDQYRNVLLLNF